MNNDKIKEQIGYLKNILNYLVIAVFSSIGWLFINLTKSIDYNIVLVSVLLSLLLIAIIIVHFSIKRQIKILGER